MPVPVDHARKHGPAGRIDHGSSLRTRLSSVEHAQDLAVVADQQPGEVRDIARRVRLHAIRMVD